jgi:hypothetical protein
MDEMDEWVATCRMPDELGYEAIEYTIRRGGHSYSERWTRRAIAEDRYLPPSLEEWAERVAPQLMESDA